MLTHDKLFAKLEDRALLDAAKRLAADERHATATLLRALMEIDTRRLYLGEGCASMFVYCTQVLHLSEGGAYNRIEAARAARTHPLILELFEQSAITLTAIRLLAPHLTAENQREVLASARHKSKREVEALVVALQPKPDAPVVVRRLPAAGGATAALLPGHTDLAPSSTSAPERVPIVAVDSQHPVAPQVPVKPAHIAPLSPERYRIQLTVSRETHDRFRRVQALLRHAVPSGDAAEIFDRAITLLAEALERRRFAETSRRCGSAAAPGPAGTGRTRHIPAAVRRDVWRRDAGRCAFVGREGRCRETAFLEFHHVEPYAAGGEATVANIQLRCHAHNEYEARLFFGDSVVRESRPAWPASSFWNEFDMKPGNGRRRRGARPPAVVFFTRYGFSGPRSEIRYCRGGHGRAETRVARYASIYPTPSTNSESDRLAVRAAIACADQGNTS